MRKKKSQRRWKKGSPRHEPENEIKQEEPYGSLAVIVGDSFGEEAGDVLVVKIEPCPAAGCGKAKTRRERNCWVAESCKDVPWGGKGEENSCAGEQVEFGQQSDLPGDRKVQEHEGYGEDQTDKPFGKNVRCHDSGEGETGD